MKTKSILFEPAESPYLVPFDGSFGAAKAPTMPPEDCLKKKANRNKSQALS